MKRSAVRSTFMPACLPWCVIALAFLTGCVSESQTTSGSQEVVKAPPPKEERVETPPETPPPPKQQEMAPEAAAPPEDPLAWAAGLADAHFEYKLAKVRKEDRAGLDALVQKLKEDSKRKVLVEGYCDSRGTAKYNLVLGERRAKAIKEYLVKAGASASQIEVVSYGKERPLCTEMTDECWQSNRRVHFTAQ